MRSSYTYLTLLLAAFITLNVHGQTDTWKILKNTDTKELRRFSEETSATFYRKKEEAKALAEAQNLPLIIEGEGYYAELMYFDDAGMPVYFSTTNVIAAQTTNTDELHSGGSLGLNLEGAGFTLGEWDGGAVLSAHEQFNGRVSQMDAPASTSNHATHVAGTLIGNGTNAPTAKGMAPQVMLKAWDFNNPIGELASDSALLLLVSNHSYAPIAGWQYNPNIAGWNWHGGTAQLMVGGEDSRFGIYDNDARSYDVVANYRPYHLICFGAGNDRNDVPATNSPCVDVENGNSFNYDPALHPGIDGPYDCMPSFQTAKNVLTVGAVDDLPNGGTPVMTSFSNWGGTDDGRIKPDLVANGFELYSASASGIDQYDILTGTSMSCPNVAGSLILLQEHYEDVHGTGNFMQSATLKALAIHTASEAGTAAGPDYQFGWGLLNAKKAVEVIDQDAIFDRTILEGTIANGETKTFHIQVADTAFRATLAWNDPAGVATAAGTLNDPTIKLVNDLDLRVTVDATNITALPYILDPTNPGNAATAGDNIRDNVEQVNIASPVGLTLTVTVTHKGTLAGPQNFSLIMSSLADYCGTITFVGPSATGSWHDPDNWDLGVVPTFCNDVVVPSAFLPNVGSEALARSVYLEAGMEILSTGSLNISGASGTGLINEGNLFLRSGGILMIDSVSGSGLNNAAGGNIILQGNLHIGQDQGIIGVHGVENAGTIVVYGPGNLSIDGMPGAGILNYYAIFNSGTIDLGQSDIGWHCLLNQTDAVFKNNSTGIIRANNTLNSGISNNAVFLNEGTIEIGQLGAIVRHGIENADTFSNQAGIIKIDQTGINAISNTGKFDNESTIEIGQLSTIGQYGIVNLDTFSNTSGIIKIDRTTLDGIFNQNKLIDNHASILIGQSAGVGRDGIRNSGNWNNFINGDVRIDHTGRHGFFLDGIAINYGSIDIGVNSGGINDKGLLISGGDLISLGSIDIANAIISGLELQGGNVSLANGSTTFIGQVAGIDGTGVHIALGDFFNSGELRIDQTGLGGITHLGGSVINLQIIDVGQFAGGISTNALYTDAPFLNLAGASIRLKSEESPLRVPNLSDGEFIMMQGSELETH